MKTERETPEEKIEAIIKNEVVTSEILIEGTIVFTGDMFRMHALKIVQLLKDQHNKELKEIREEIEAQKISRTTTEYAFDRALIQAQEIINKHIK